MYALPRGRSKIVASTRRGNPRAHEVSENRRDQTESVGPEVNMSSVAKPVFAHNGRTRNQPRPIPSNSNMGYMSAYHQEAAEFLENRWNSAMKEYCKHSSQEGASERPEWYRPRDPNPAMENFKKFDLEEHWASRTYHRLTQAS